MAGLQEYKCPCCDGAIAFDSSSQKMKCPFCDTEFDMEVLAGYDADLKADGADDMVWESQSDEWQEGEASNMGVYICQSCSGQIIGDKNTVATACPYCDSPIVMKGHLSGDLKPDMVIPFKLDKQAAMAAYERHLQGKRLLPKVFKEQNHIDEMKGMYVPFWIFDTDTDASFRYKAKKIRRYSDDDYDYTETKTYSVVRKGGLSFEGVPVDGSSKMPDALMESIEPFDLTEAVDFQTAYLAGFVADRYDVDQETSVERANARVKSSTEQTFAATVKGYDSFTKEAGSIRLLNGHSRYGLFPIWLLNTTWNDTKYTFAMNGQTGKFVGDLPVDKAAKNKWFWGITGITTVVCGIISSLIWVF